MRSCVLLSFLLLLCLPGSPAIKIQVGKFTYMLETVLKLADLMEGDDKDLAHAAQKICHDPKLPEEFKPVCAEDDAPDIFIKLVQEAKNVVDECEICANPACPGCL